MLIGIRKSIPFRFVPFFSIVSLQSVSHTFLFNEEKENVGTIVARKGHSEVCESGHSCEENFVQTVKPKVATVATKEPHHITIRSLLTHKCGSLHIDF